jgi:hypothetical protein
MNRSIEKLAVQYQERASEYNTIRQNGSAAWLALSDEIKECVKELNRHFRDEVLIIDAKDGTVSVKRKFDHQVMLCRFDSAEHIAYFDSEKPEFHHVMPLEVRGGALTFVAPSADGSHSPKTSDNIAFEALVSFLSR